MPRRSTKTDANPPTAKEPATERAFELMLYVAAQPTSVNLRELIEQTGYSKSTVHRLMGRLERIGVIERDSQSNQYRVGPRLLKLTQRSGNDLEPRRIALPIMEALRDKCGETVSLHALDGDQQVAIEKCDGSAEIRRVLPIGRRVPLCVGATAKAILAFLSKSRVEAILKGARDKGLDNPSSKELQAIRNAGYAISIGEITPGLTAVSTPVYDHRGEVWGGLSVSGPTFRFTRERAKSSLSSLMDAAAKISSGLGHRP